ncbi:hypothetical protein GRF29_96g1483046 [Pseudopithomyces chartarum]|uniref:Uncharacterized protein n=1 Tax=Pseudopithomyces chartarum TaxID=1892770 RepID=A0AAN6RH98_9PLEO|nr:hypothetical protein GRF29_96g1483046 [Pseudopithomyces chartarum]
MAGRSRPAKNPQPARPRCPPTVDPSKHVVLLAWRAVHNDAVPAAAAVAAAAAAAAPEPATGAVTHVVGPPRDSSPFPPPRCDFGCDRTAHAAGRRAHTG